MSAGRAHTSHRTSVRHAGHGLREGSVERPAEDKFCIFISHKHEDHALAMAVRDALHRLGCGRIECFVSGVDIAAGADWNRQIKSRLAQSHLLILLFTSPSQNWDWCLYEAGLFTRFDVEDVSAIVCLFNPETGSPRPLANLQGVSAQPEAVEKFLGELLPRDLVHLRRLAPRCARIRRRREARRFRGEPDRVGLPEGIVRGAFALRVSPRRARPHGSRRDRCDHPGVGDASSKAKAQLPASRCRCSTGPTGASRSHGVISSTPSTASTRHGAISSIAASSPR